MLCGKKWAIDVWRKGTAVPSGNWGDPAYAYLFTFSGVVQPFEASDGTRNNQRFANIRHLITCEITTDVTDADELIFKGETERVAFVEECESSIIDHLEIFTTNSQWERT